MSYLTRSQAQKLIEQMNNKAFLANTKLIETMFSNFKSSEPFTDNLEAMAKKNIAEMDRIQFIERYEWKNLPNITPTQLERLMYEKGQLMMFYSEETDKYYYLPYSLEGTIDVYGRYNNVKPVPMGTTYEELKERNKVLYDFLSGINREVAKTEEDLNAGMKTTHCALLFDRTPGLSETIVSRNILADEIIKFQAETIPFLRTTLINDTGTKAIRVTNADEQSSVALANAAKIRAAKTGQGFVSIVGALEFQDLNAGGTAQTTEFLQSYQAIDNIRKSFMGLGSGAAFEKNAHMLQSEQSMNSQSADDVLEDGLNVRKKFCEIANKIFGTNISVEKKEKQQELPMPMEDNPNNQGGQQDD